MRNLLAAAASAVLLVGAAQASVVPVVLTADADTYVRDGMGSGSAHGADPFVRVERSEGVQPERLCCGS